MKRPAMAEQYRQQLFDNVRRREPTSHLHMADDKPIVIWEVDEGPDAAWREIGRVHRGSRIRGHAL